MSQPWTVCVQRDAAAALTRLRSVPLEVCADGNRIWLKGTGINDELDKTLRSLPGVQRYTVLSDRQLLPVGARVPKGYLPDGPWIRLSDWIEVKLDTAALAGVVSQKVQLELVRSHSPNEPNMLLTSLETWTRYAELAPQVRLERLVFAVSSDDRVALRGTPLPPVAGTRYVERDGIAAPAGWSWSPAVDPAAVRDALGLSSGDVAILREDGSWDHIRGDDFVPCDKIGGAFADVGWRANGSQVNAVAARTYP